MFLAVPEAAFEFGFLIFLFGRFVGGFMGRDLFAALYEGYEGRKIASPGFWPDIPEISFQIRNRPGKAGDDLKVYGNTWTEHSEAREKLLPIHQTLAHGGPLHLSAVLIFPNHGVPDSGAENV